MGKDLEDTLVWEIKEELPAGADKFDHLLAFYLLPQVATKPHMHNKGYTPDNKGIENMQLSGPQCDEMYIRFVSLSVKEYFYNLTYLLL